MKIDSLNLVDETRKMWSGKWGDGVVFVLLYALLSVAVAVIYSLFWGLFGVDISSDDSLFLNSLFSVFVVIPYQFGALMVFLSFVKGENDVNVKCVFNAFRGRYYWKSIGVNVLLGIYVFLWTLLLVIPGVIKALSYAMAPYIIAENPEIGCEEAIKRSMRMMDGHKTELFVLYLVFFGLSILSVFTLGIAYLWVIPWAQSAVARFYLIVRATSENEEVE